MSAATRTLRIRAAVNDWISRNFPVHRVHMLHSQPRYQPADGCWLVDLRSALAKDALVGQVRVSDASATILDAPLPEQVIAKLQGAHGAPQTDVQPEDLIREDLEFRHADGMAGTAKLADGAVDLLLTDPPYGISKSYGCEKQVPRRLRSNGSDFIMPRGFFGAWDVVDPEQWTSVTLPKVGGWAVIFCAQAQIGVYCDILREHDFVAVGTLVWQKSNPVPFNHHFKPINAWEALVVGKRSGTPFHGRAVHNVFRFKSPSPQQRLHPTQKPLPLIERFVDLFSSEGDLVLDPFAGSGTTVVAAARKKRRVIAYENTAEIYQKAYERILAECASPRLLP